MPTSEARIAANRANSLKSTGPRTIEGKDQSRRNALKHGLSGAGVVVAEVDVDEVERRAEELQEELGPRSAMGRILVRDLATLSVRMERGARQESAALATRVRNAADAFDEARVDRAGQLLDSIADDPRGQVRKLRRSPEGVDRLVGAWSELLDDLTRDPRPTWTAWHLERAANLSGIRVEQARGSEIGVLSRAAWGDFGGPGGQGPDIEAEAESRADVDLEEGRRKAEARARLVARIDAEVDALEDHRATLDLEAIALDRAGSGDVALFDPSREATLARRYESEARRGFYTALKEFRRAEAEALDRPAPAPEMAGPAPDELGSFRGDPPIELVDPFSLDHEIPAMPFRASSATSPGMKKPLHRPEAADQVRTGPD